eukprot:GEMP01043534.1.p1 GENE.GEMP01043534.1~~GEMP01043534.1.p1  ORF type:complete len:108 (-),score=4.77 GEMP01043534.1:40-363(-)
MCALFRVFFRIYNCVYACASDRVYCVRLFLHKCVCVCVYGSDEKMRESPFFLRRAQTLLYIFCAPLRSKIFCRVNSNVRIVWAVAFFGTIEKCLINEPPDAKISTRL